MPGYNIREPLGGALLKDATASAQIGNAFDTRNSRNHGFMEARTSGGGSGQVTLQASPDGVNWYNVTAMIALTGGATAQITGYFPFVRAQVNAIWSGSNVTGYPSLNYLPSMT